MPCFPPFKPIRETSVNRSDSPADFYNVHLTQILQNEYEVVILYQYAQTWRVSWTDGRPVPKVVDGGALVGNEVREPRYYGYSVGKWVDDSTLVVGHLRHHG